jgi:transposase
MAFQALSDEQWEEISFYLPAKGRIGRPRRDDRECLNAILYVLSTDCRWCELPKWLPPKTTVHRRFKEWAKGGFFRHVFESLSRNLPKSEVYHLDSSLKAAKKGATRWERQGPLKAARSA